MNYSVYKMNFKTGVHIGSGKLSDGNAFFCADTLFSALCHEALNLGGKAMLEELIDFVQTGKIRMSDGMPFIKKDQFYLPKPMIPIKGKQESNSVEKKAYKKLQYIPMNQFSEYLQGAMDVQKIAEEFNKNFGDYSIRTMSAVEENKDTVPYSVGVYRFHENAGLYVIMGFETEEAGYLASDVFESLSYTGIGGKRSSGLGKFELKVTKVPAFLEQHLQLKNDGSFMALSICMPGENELENVLESRANYSLIKRSGFVSSDTYADSFQKKKPFFAFKSGSCFNKKFDGVLADVANGGAHPVYRYAKALLMEID